MAPTIGIDLGTTNSLCAVFEDGAPRLIPNALGSYLTPSVVGLLPDGQVLVGQAARDLRVTEPEATVAWFKRWMGTDQTCKLRGRSFHPAELSSMVLRTLAEDAAADLGEAVTDVVITVPAYFNEHQRKATVLAGQLAGLKVRRIVNEPSAAALAYGLADKEADKHLVVFDLGGGTFDVSVLEVFEGNLEIRASAGENHLGGEDFTDRLADRLLKRDGRALEPAELKSPKMVARLRRECDRVKHELGAGADSATLRMPDDDGVLPDAGQEVEVSAAEFAAMTDDLVRRLLRPLERALGEAELPDSEIDEVVLVGGATRMHHVVAALTAHLDKPPLRGFDPDTVVALGAAVQAALIDRDEAVEDVVMTDVCPFTLGVDVVKDLGGKQDHGYYLAMIHRNTTIPVSKEKLLGTVVDNQTRVDIDVYQGESRRVEDNLMLGTLEVNGIPKAPAGAQVAVRFTYDSNGLLEVEARVEATGKKVATVFTNHCAHLSLAELAQARANMAELKFYPRENQDNQRLLQLAASLVGEVSRFQREDLEQALDAYEAALNHGEPEEFGRARKTLLELLNAFGINLEGDFES